ncbi:hypothetical protein [Yoonia sp. R78084]|uniref:hypothetical protein n=1 Tax=Yoonia sp. R78084 TaxID=3093869 RepID=UPI0037DD10A1
MLKVDAPDPNPTSHTGAITRDCRLAKGTKEVNLDHGIDACANGPSVAHMSLAERDICAKKQTSAHEPVRQHA